MPVFPPHSKTAARESESLRIGSIVEYEHSGKPMLAVIAGEKKGKWQLLNQRNREAEFTSDRLYLLPGRLPDGLSDLASKAAFLDQASKDAEALAHTLDLGEVWEILAGEVEEASVKQVTDLLFSEDSLVKHLATRRALLGDRLYFKRKKLGFEPRASDIVEELRVQLAVEEEKQRRREKLKETILQRLRDPQSPLIPADIESIEQLAALGGQADQARDTNELVHEIIDKAGLDFRGKPEHKAFQLLVAIGHFSPDETLALHRFKRLSRFSSKVMEAAAQSISNSPLESNARRDLTKLRTVTIDAESTRDIDDALSLETLPEGFRLGIHISDAAAFIAPESPLDEVALNRATSVYLPDQQIPMLPPILSEESLSLVQGEPRLALSFFIALDREYQIIAREIVRSVISVSHRLNYEEVDRVLFDEHREGDISDPSVRAELLELWHAACKLEERRIEAGASSFTRREMNPVVREDGRVALEGTTDDDPSRKLVGELMILANETAALYAAENRLPFVFRGQDAPEVNLAEVGQEIPEGPAREFYRRSFIKRSTTGILPGSHYGLGLRAYAQATSPIRRAGDLLNQRQLVHHLEQGATLYDAESLTYFLGRLESGLYEANIIQREGNRYWLLKYLAQEGIKLLKAIVMKTDGPKPLAEVDILFSLFPFKPLGSKKIGDEILLEIQHISPRDDQLTLVEITA